MTDFEKRLTDAMSGREREMDLDPHAWQTHLDLVRAAESAHRPVSMARRWRAPALVAASVVAVGLIGAMVSQSGLVGTDPVRPAGVTSPAVGPASTGTRVPGPDSSGAGPRSSGAGPRSSGAGPRSSGAGPRSSGAGLESTGVEPASGLPATAPFQPTGPSASVNESAPAMMTTTRRPVQTSSREPLGENNTAGIVMDPPGASMESDAVTAINRASLDLTSLLPCGSSLPLLEKGVSDLTLSYGPFGYLTNTGRQPVPVLATGLAIVSDSGKIASVTGGNPDLAKVTSRIVPPGKTPGRDLPAVAPMGVCDAVTPDRVSEVAQSRAPVFPAPSVTGVPTGIYWATSVVLIGTDLAHAKAYRADNRWQVSIG